MTPSASDTPTLIGIDVGGTFTDFVLLRDGRLAVHKVPTTPDDQSRAILDGLRQLDLAANASLDIVHGMTVATNALLERRGARTALITTEGFADVLVIGRQNRPHLYRLHQSRPAPLVADAWRLEAPERLDHTGRVLQALDEKAVRALVDKLAASPEEARIESVAVALLFAFRQPEHERRIAALIRERLPDLPVSLSSEVLPEYREYERTATTVIHAYVQPLVASYLGRLDKALAENFHGSRVRIMQSHGGIIGLAQAASQAGRLVLSGPAGGVVGAFEIARQAISQSPNLPISESQEIERLGDFAPRILTLDMGGTSTDVALCPGKIPTTAESTITDLPLRLPVIDIHTVGAGGGSIALVDAAGGLRVGPRSAGAVPGPICYGRGGTEPTVTDANLVLGRLDARGFLARDASTESAGMTLDGAAAQLAFERLGASLNLSAQAAALGVIHVANATMERALRAVSVERGHDPADFVLVPFGGAGPLHACDLADSLGVQQILVPSAPGVLSAYGMLVADVAADASQSLLHEAAALIENPQPLRDAFTTLREQTTHLLHDEGIAEPIVDASLDLRYRGQSYELTVPLSTKSRSEIDSAGMVDAVAAFHDAHEQRYGYAAPDEAVEAVTLRVRAHAPGARPSLPHQPLGDADPSAARLADTTVWFSTDEGDAQPLVSACYARARLQPGNRFAGPALVLQYDTTIVAAPGWSARVDGMGNLWVEIQNF